MSDSTDIVELAKWVGSVDQRVGELERTIPTQYQERLNHLAKLVEKGQTDVLELEKKRDEQLAADTKAEVARRNQMARLGIASSIYTELLSQRVGDLMARRDLGVLAELALDAADELLEQHHIRIREEAEGGGQ